MQTASKFLIIGVIEMKKLIEDIPCNTIIVKIGWPMLIAFIISAILVAIALARM